MVVRIAGKRMYLWRAVDHEGEVLDARQLRGCAIPPVVTLR
jgi:transposase-like protein